jgi:hypothetical protein
VLFLIIALPPIIAVALVYWFRLRRKRVPIVIDVYEEGLEASITTRMSRVRTHEHSNIEQLTKRINEIEKKIRIIKMQKISEEAKNIAIRELEEEEKRLREEIKKLSGSEQE